jgi:mannose-6-phosphate isomerase
MNELYPLHFKEILRNYGFGNRWMTTVFAKELPEDHRLAETWEVCDRPGESSQVTNGPLEGRTLHELIAQYQADLLGTAIIADFGLRFPLLIKFLDASNVLGEQVHQNDELARKRGLADPGKTEAWYMLETREGATIRCGNRPGVTRQDALQALLSGEIRFAMQEYPVQPGDAFLLYAGTMHYSKGGALFYEIMQNSYVIIGLRKPDESLDTAEREKRALAALEGIYLEEGFDCKTVPVTIDQGPNQRTFILACQNFALERLDLSAPLTFAYGPERFYVLSQTRGNSTVRYREHALSLRPGNTCLLPACLGQVIVEPEARASLLKAYVPDLAHDVIAPLKQAGSSDQAIRALGGKTDLNPLNALV